MEDCCDRGGCRLLKMRERKHRSKPPQFSCVADGVKKRLESSSKYRKNSRLSVFDNFRNLSECDSPTPGSSGTVQLNVDHKAQRLEKWKKEREKKKKEAAAHKKKPFVVGVVHAPILYVPPPPPPNVPNTYGRVTKSQSARINTKCKGTKQTQTVPLSSLPENAKDVKDAGNTGVVDNFRQQLASVIERMTEMCETWHKILEQIVLPEAVQEAVLLAVGQARLLISQKLNQLAGLVEKCAHPEPGSALIRPVDLQGFWDMVFLQVEIVMMSFKKLEELRSSGWVENAPVKKKKKVVKPKVKKVTKPAVAAPSLLREVIAAAKAKKQQEEHKRDNKSFEGGFFSIHTPVRTAALVTRSRNSVLEAGQSREARKSSARRNSASFAMLRASMLSKNVECDERALLPLQTDSGISSTDLENVENDENFSRECKLVRQDAVDRSHHEE